MSKVKKEKSKVKKEKSKVKKEKSKVKNMGKIKKRIDLDLINCTRDQCLKFSNKVMNDEFKKKELKRYFKEYSKDYSEEDAINIMKNLVIIGYYIDFSKIEYNTYSGRLLLNLTKYINIPRTSNFKILYALCMSQFNKEQTAFSEDACKEVIDEIQMRFYCLVDEIDYEEAFILKCKLKRFNWESKKFTLSIY